MMVRKLISPAAKGIAETFRTSPLEHCDVNGHGISEMSVEWRGHTIGLAWYGRGRPRSLCIDNDTGFPEGADSLHIFQAAWARADQITSEMIARLDADPPDGPEQPPEPDEPPEALADCLFRWCPTIDRCRDQGCTHPWSERSICGHRRRQ